MVPHGLQDGLDDDIHLRSILAYFLLPFFSVSALLLLRHKALPLRAPTPGGNGSAPRGMIWRSAAALSTRWSSSAARRLLLLQGPEPSSSSHCRHVLGSHSAAAHSASGACGVTGPSASHGETSSSTSLDFDDDVLWKPQVAPGRAAVRETQPPPQVTFFPVTATNRQASSDLSQMPGHIRSGYNGLGSARSMSDGAAAGGMDAEVVVPKSFARPESPLGAAAAAAMAPNNAIIADRSMLLPKEHTLPVAAFHIGEDDVDGLGCCAERTIQHLTF